MQTFITEFHRIIIPLCIFLALFIIDLVLGVLKGKFVEGISSEKLRLSVPKFCAYIGMALMCYLLDCLILTSTDISYSPITLLALIFFCITEIKSIIENAQILGVKTPIFITTMLTFISEKLGFKKEK